MIINKDIILLLIFILFFDFVDNNRLRIISQYYSLIISKYNNYLTSDMILHFQWKSNSTHIKVLDITWHYKSNGEFWLPSSKNLE